MERDYQTGKAGTGRETTKEKVRAGSENKPAAYGNWENYMSWDDVFKIIISMLASIGGIGGLIVLIIKFSANIIADRLSKKYETILQRELDDHKAQLESKTYISKIKFDREFAMYQELSEKNMTMVYDMGAAVLLTRGAQPVNIENPDEFIHLAAQHLEDADFTNKKYAPFIAKEIFEKYRELGKRAHEIISLFAIWNAISDDQPLIGYKGSWYTKDTATAEIFSKQQALSKLSDDILDKLRDYLSSLEIVEDK